MQLETNHQDMRGLEDSFGFHLCVHVLLRTAWLWKLSGTVSSLQTIVVPPVSI